MITKYFKTVSVRFDPFNLKHKSARVLLANIPPKLRASIKTKYEILPKDSKKEPEVVVSFKDGMVIKIDPTQANILDIGQQLDRHSRSLATKEIIDGI